MKFCNAFKKITLVIVILFSGSVLAARDTLLVGYMEGMKPLIYQEYDGRIKGLSADYFNQFSKSHPGINFSYQAFSDEKNLCTAFRKGEVKIALGFTQYSSCKLSTHPQTLWRSSLYEVRNRKKENTSYSTVYYSDKEIDNATLADQYPHAKLIPTDNEQTIVEALLTKSNAVYISSLLQADRLLGEYPSLLTANLMENMEKVRYSMRVSWQVPQTVATDLAEFIRIQGEHVPNNFETKWFNYANFYSQKPLSLSYEQQQWIKAHPVIKVAVPRYAYPLGYIDDSDNFQGVSAEILKSVSNKTGITFIPVPVITVGDMMDDIKNHRVDMGAHRAIGDKNDKAIFSDPILITRFVAMVRKNATITSEILSLNNKRLALPRGQTLRDYFLKKIPGVRLITINGTMINGLNLVVNNTADAVIAPEIIARYWVDTYYLGKIKLVPLAIPAINIAFPVREDFGILKSILNDTMSDIPYSSLRTVDPHWTDNITPPTTIIPKISLFVGLAVSFILTCMVIISLIIYRVKLSKQQRKNLEQYNNTLTTILDSTPFPVYISDCSGKLLFRNKALQYLVMKVDNHRASSENLFNLFNDKTGAISDLHALALEKNSDVMSENRFVLGDRNVFLKFWALPVSFQDNAETHILGGWIDLTEKKILEDSLKQEKQIAINNAEEKTLFLAKISHEIRTPLSIIIGLMEIISSKARTLPRANLEHQAQIAFRNTSSLLGLLDQLITFAKEGSEHSDRDDEKTSVNIQQLLDDTLALFAIRAAEKGLEFNQHFESSSGTQFLCDRLKIQQLLSNLLSNALKFTHYGSVSVSTRIQPVSDTYSTIDIEVKDTGPGIREEHVERIFEVFEQEDTLTDPRYGGFGLGLAICRQISLALGGTITLSSKYGQGTCVTMTIPLQHTLQKETDILVIPQEADFTLLHVAILEDNRASRFLLKTQLETLGVVVSEVDSIDALDTLNQTDIPDAIISDFEMKTFTGIDVLRHLRSKFVFPPLCYIHTANAGHKDAGLYLDAGATGVIIKPVSVQHLTMILSDIVTKQPAQRFMRQIERLASGRHGTIKAMLHELRESIYEDVAMLEIKDNMDEERTRHHIHSLKGAMSMIKRLDIVSCCDDYLAAVRSHTANTPQAWLALKSQLDQLTGIIDECTECL
ncbi:ATP-binding protein [Cedecea davisae]|uniref:ATP-binding protein n=1 Tax=Cedecea davisae TaxID=158484 RepID=UPI00376F04C5